MNSFTSDFVREKLCLYMNLPWAIGPFGLMKEAAKRHMCGVELLNTSELCEPDRKVARELSLYAKQNGLKIPCLSVGKNLVGNDRAEAIAAVKGYAEICSDLEIPYLHHTVAYDLSPHFSEEEMARRFRLGVEATCEIADYARGLGVKTLLEDQGFLVNGVEGYRHFRRATSNVFDVLLDTGNIYFVDETAGAFAEAYGRDIPHIHVKEYTVHTAPPGGTAERTRKGDYLTLAVAGEGSVDYPRVKKALQAADYKGLYSTEYFFRNEDEMSRTFTFLSSLFGDM